MSYQGWKNYETWCVNLWLENDEGLYRDWTSHAEEFANKNVADIAAGKLAREMKAELSDMAPELEGVWSNLLSAALSEVSWYEIADAWVQTALQNGAGQEEIDDE